MRELTHIESLEAQSIHIIREAMAGANRPAMLYSIGKDSSVMLHLARKAFYPGKLPFPLLHIDTMWKFREMIEFRDQVAKQSDVELLVYSNADGIKNNINPFDHDTSVYTDVMKTQALKQALDNHGFDVAICGARRDEEMSRAKERVFSLRTTNHVWDPKKQRPEPWNIYNTQKTSGESMRVFPLSNWTEYDVWQYIKLEDIPVVSLYMASKRPVVERSGTLLMVDDKRMPLMSGEQPEMRMVRFRTLGCYPLSGAVESNASSLNEVIEENMNKRFSERQGRIIDQDTASSMELKKREGYF